MSRPTKDFANLTEMLKWLPLDNGNPPDNDARFKNVRDLPGSYQLSWRITADREVSNDCSRRSNVNTWRLYRLSGAGTSIGQDDSSEGMFEFSS